MPIYEYRCAQGHQYEQTEGFDAPSEQTCPQCGEPSHRLLSIPGVIFKGSGFYSTDYRSDERASARQSFGDDGAKEESSTPSPTESKSDASA